MIIVLNYIFEQQFEPIQHCCKSLVPWWNNIVSTNESCKICKENTYYKGKPHKTITSILRKFKIRQTPFEAALYMCGYGQCESKFKKYNKYKINYIPSYQLLSNKSSLAEIIKHSQYQDIMPKQWIIPQEMEQLQEFDKTYDKLYIIKPSLASQGKGIIVGNNINDLLKRSNSTDILLQHKWYRNDSAQQKQNEQKRLLDQPRTYNIKYKTLVIQEYLESLLIDNHKLDFRVYILVTSLDPLILYYYDEGLVRFAGKQYIIDEKENQTFQQLKKSMLTNTYISKRVQNNDHDIIWSFDEYIKYCEKNQQIFENYTFTREKFYQNLNNIVSKIFNKNMVQKLIDNVPNEYKENFYAQPRRYYHLLGIDLLPMKDGSMKLLEINSNPSLDIEIKNQAEIKYPMINEMLHIISIRQQSINKIYNDEQKHQFLDQQFQDLDISYDEKEQLMQQLEEYRFNNHFIRVKIDKQLKDIGRYNTAMIKYQEYQQ